MLKISENIIRYLMVHTRRKGRLAFSSRDALSLILIAGLPFVMVSSFSINKSVNQNAAYAYSSSQPAAHVQDGDRMVRHVAAQIKSNPEALLKMNGKQVAVIFSTPGLQRIEGDMDLWQYRTPSCVMDLYIADNGKGAVAHYEMRSRAKVGAKSDRDDFFDQAARRDCIKSVLNGHDGITPMIFASR